MEQTNFRVYRVQRLCHLLTPGYYDGALGSKLSGLDGHEIVGKIRGVFHKQS